MRILITSTGPDPNAAVDSRFGRADYFIVHDDTNGAYETYENEGKWENTGAGVRASRFIGDQQIDVVITGSLGPKAYAVISEADIPAFKIAEGSVEENISAYYNHGLEPITEAGDVVKNRGQHQ